MSAPPKALAHRLWGLASQPVPGRLQGLLDAIEGAPDRAAADRAVAAAAAGGCTPRLMQRAYRRFLAGQAYRVPA